MFDINALVLSLKKDLKKQDVFILILLVALFFLTRLINLESLPIFSDEGIYIRWAKTAWHDASWRFISLTDGRQPLQTWGIIPFLKLFPKDALLAGRLFSVTTGFITFIGIFSFLRYLFGKKTAFIGSFFYIFTPYFLFYDRIALIDSAVNASFIWILFFSIMLVKTIRLDTALIFGLVSGVSLLVKSSVVMFLGLSFFSPILIFDKSNKTYGKKVLNIFILFLLVVVLALIIYNVQRLSPFMHYIGKKNNTFVMTFGEFLKSPFAVFFHNIKIIPLYVFWELGWVVAFFGIAGFFALYKKNIRLFFYFFIWMMVSFFAIAFFSKVIFPRYLIFFGTMMVIAASFFVAQLSKNSQKIISFLLITASFFYVDYSILFHPQTLFFPPIDRGQYIEGNTAGWGVGELMDYARDKSKEKPVILLAEGDFGLIGDVLETFVKPGDHISIRGYWPLEKKELQQNQKELKDHFVFAVFAQRREFPKDWPLELIQKFEKPGNQSAIYFFELANEVYPQPST